MKKYFKYIILFLSLSISLASCIDVIELDLKNTEPRLIFEANLNATDSTCHVLATYSNDFYDTGKVQKVENLEIILTKNNTEIYLLNQTEDGEYYANNIVAEKGDVFEISITDKNTDKTYKAKAETPSMPGYFLVIFTSFGDEDITFTDSLGNEKLLLFGLAYWFDIPDEENYYRIKVYKDAGREYINDSYNFVSDKFAIGDTMQMGLKTYFVEDDTVKIELSTINKETYDYFEQIIEVLYSGGNFTTPFNPKGNFDNNALGYFCIEQTRSFNFVVFKFPFF